MKSVSNDLRTSWENYFNIQFSDIEGQQIETVQQSVDYVVRHLNISSKSSPLEAQIKKKIENALKETAIGLEYLNSSTHIFTILYR